MFIYIKIYKDIEKELITYQKHFDSSDSSLEEDVCIFFFLLIKNRNLFKISSFIIN